MRSIHSSSFLALIIVPILAIPASADEACTADSDCPDGLVCMFMPCPDIACASDEDCPICEPEGICQKPWDEDDWSWYGTECETSADCPTGFACEEMAMPCAIDGCAPCACDCREGDENCECECQECPMPEPCEGETVNVCVYHPVECKADSDCSEGFECVAHEICNGGGACTCAGCMCPPCPEGEDCACECPEPQECECDLPTEPECQVEGSFCQPRLITCEDDSGCPTDWECLVVGGSDCACGPCACMACPEGDECEPCVCEPCVCEDATEEKACVPQGWMDAGYPGGGINFDGEPREPTTGEQKDSTGQEGGSQNPPSADADLAADDGAGGCNAGSRTDIFPMALLLSLFVILTVRRRLTA